MFGHHYFGARYFGARYFGAAVGGEEEPAPAPDPVVASGGALPVYPRVTPRRDTRENDEALLIHLLH